jgi:hypothetical protein
VVLIGSFRNIEYLDGTSLMLRPVSFERFPSYYSSIILPFDAVQSESLITSLKNDLFTSKLD